MTQGTVNVRVAMQSRIGTTIVWNIDVLNETQRRTWVLSARMVNEDGSVGEWFIPKNTKPPLTGALAAVVNQDTDYTMIPNVVTGLINDRSTFDVKLVFGQEMDAREVMVRIVPYGNHSPYIKPRRIELAEGKVVYAEPVYVADISPEAATKIANAVLSQAAKGTT